MPEPGDEILPRRDHTVFIRGATLDAPMDAVCPRNPIFKSGNNY